MGDPAFSPADDPKVTDCQPGLSLSVTEDRFTTPLRPNIPGSKIDETEREALTEKSPDGQRCIITLCKAPIDVAQILHKRDDNLLLLDLVAHITRRQQSSDSRSERNAAPPIVFGDQETWEYSFVTFGLSKLWCGIPRPTRPTYEHDTTTFHKSPFSTFPKITSHVHPFMIIRHNRKFLEKVPDCPEESVLNYGSIRSTMEIINKAWDREYEVPQDAPNLVPASRSSADNLAELHKSTDDGKQGERSQPKRTNASNRPLKRSAGGAQDFECVLDSGIEISPCERNGKRRTSYATWDAPTAKRVRKNTNTESENADVQMRSAKSMEPRSSETQTGSDDDQYISPLPPGFDPGYAGCNVHEWQSKTGEHDPETDDQEDEKLAAYRKELSRAPRDDWSTWHIDWTPKSGEQHWQGPKTRKFSSLDWAVFIEGWYLCGDARLEDSD
ncbi:hypothetical protein FRB99_001171 [Tulasnella sp. 403]|nr:hypothetical protein FRB99_001171 [Tulasnella sp. 403]